MAKKAKVKTHGEGMTARVGKPVAGIGITGQMVAVTLSKPKGFSSGVGNLHIKTLDKQRAPRIYRDQGYSSPYRWRVVLPATKGPHHLICSTDIADQIERASLISKAKRDGAWWVPMIQNRTVCAGGLNKIKKHPGFLTWMRHADKEGLQWLAALPLAAVREMLKQYEIAE